MELNNFVLPIIGTTFFGTMMLLILLLLGILVYVISSFFFTIGVVQGKSMLPTYKPWEPILIKKKYTLQNGKCYVFKHEDKPVVKRLTGIRVGLMNGKVLLWFLGDNSNDSLDSREYGFVQEDAIIGEVVKFGGNKQ